MSEFGAFCSNTTENVNGYGLVPLPEEQSLQLIQKVVSIVVPILFGLIVLVGLFGNALVSTCISHNLILEDMLSSQHTGLSLKITVFWDVASCSLVEIDGDHRPNDGGSKHL
jgi:hypothetical protein